MSTRSLALIVFLAIGLASCIDGAWQYPLLPDRVASHFDLSGKADGWSTKQNLLSVHLGTIGLVTLTILACGFGISKLPVSVLNLPNREYWLAEERAADTFRTLSSFVLWFGSATLMFIAILFHQVFQVNLKGSNALPSPMTPLCSYLGFVIFWMVWLMMRFSKRSPSESSPAQSKL